MDNRFIFILIFFQMVFIIGCREKIEKSNPDNSFKKPFAKTEDSAGIEPDDIVEQIEAFSLEGYDNNRKKSWQIKGTNAEVVGERVTLEKIKAKSFNEEGEAILTSEEGWINKKTHDVYLNKDVVITTSDGAKLYTDSINWNKNARIVYTKDIVKVKQADISLKGKGAQADVELDKLTLKHSVRLEAEPSTVITCEGPLDIDYKKNIAIFNKNVKVTTKDGQLLADKMEVLFNPKTRDIEEVTATGCVIIKMGKNISQCKKAIYSVKESKVRLLGNPKLIIYPSQLKEKLRVSE